MNKQIKQFLEENGLCVKQNQAYGAFKGYETNFLQTDATSLVARISFFADAEQRGNIIRTLISQNTANFLAETTENGVLLRLKIKTFGKSEEWKERLTNVIDTLSQNGALGVGYCPSCGKELNFDECKKCQVDGWVTTLCGDCTEKLNSEIRAENAAFDSLPNNYLRGFGGAVLGALVGCALAVVLYVAGFVSALSSVVAVVLGALLYQKLGGKPNKMMLVIVSATSVVLMLASTFGIYLVACKIAFDEAGANVSAMEAFVACMNDSEFSSSFVSDMLMTALFTAIGVGIEIFDISKKIRRNKETF